MRLSFKRRRSPRAAFRYFAEDAPSGYGDAADRLVRAVRGSGVRVEYRGWSTGREDDLPAGTNPHSRDPRPTDRGTRGAPTVAHVVPEQLPRVRKAIRRGSLIAHTVWETDRLPSHWPALLDHADRVIVPTEWNREIFVASGVTTPVVVVPHVVCDPVPGDGGLPLDLPPDVIVFYTIGRWDQRKAPAAVIRAFLESFTADDPVALVVKTSGLAQFPAPTRWGADSQISGTTMLEVVRIVREYPRPPLVRVEIEDWTPARLAGLHTRGDCYVSLSHGEGWGLGAFDAAAYGNPVVMTGWGGQLAYLDAETAFLVDHDVASVRHWEQRSYAPDQRWAVPRQDHAVELLREVATDLEAARRRATPLREKVLHDYAPARVAATLLEVAPELATAAPDVQKVRTEQTARATRSLRRRSRSEDLLLVGLTVGKWRSAFDNWVEMAERHGYRYELLGREIAEPFLAHATKWRLLGGFFADLPRRQLVFYLDAEDGFVCADPDATLARYGSYGASVVFGAVARRDQGKPLDVASSQWDRANAGAYIGEAGVIADAHRDGYGLVDWERVGRVSDQRVLRTYFKLPEHRHKATVDSHRTIVQNIAASKRSGEYDEHRLLLERGERGARGSCTSSVHFFGNNGPGYNSFAALYALSPVELDDDGRFFSSTHAGAVGSATSTAVPAVGHSSERIPRIAHYVFGLRPEPEEFHLVHYLAIESCRQLVLPDEIHLHCHHPPHGRYWDLISPHVIVHRVEPAPAVSDMDYDDPLVARYAYAHHTDFLRLDVLAEYGGLYADLDTLFVARPSERLWRTAFVIGREADVPNSNGGVPRPAVSNAVLMASPYSAFLDEWRSEICAAFDGTWANHCCFLPADLAMNRPDDVHVEPQRTFHAFEPTREGVGLLLEASVLDLEGITALHLMAHLWWEDDRRDFSSVHAGMIDEAWVRDSASTYAAAARRFLPQDEP